MELTEKVKRRPRGASARGMFEASKEAALSLIEKRRAEDAQKTDMLRAMRLSRLKEGTGSDLT